MGRMCGSPLMASHDDRIRITQPQEPMNVGWYLKTNSSADSAMRHIHLSPTRSLDDFNLHVATTFGRGGSSAFLPI